MKKKAGSLKKNKHNSQTPGKSALVEGGKDPNQLNQKCKRGDNNKHQRNPGNHQRLL
jgi:hypothetical protein